MKIGLVIDDSLDKPDGVQQYVLTLGKWLTEKGHEVHYLAGETMRRDIPNVHSLAKNIRVRFNKNRAAIPISRKKEKIRRVLSSDFDVLHIQMPYSPILGGYIVKRAKPKTLIFGTFHVFPYSKLERLANRLLCLGQKASLKRFDSFVCVSEAAKSFAEQSIKKPSQVVPNAVELGRFKVNKPASRVLKIVFLGRLVERKGSLELLKAVNLLNQQKKLAEVEVRIGGSGPLAGALEKYVKVSGLESSVKFDGFIAEEDKPNYLASAEIAVFPSTGGESFGIVLLEGMAAGSLVIAGDNPGYRTVITDERMIIDATDTRSFASALEKLIRSAAYRTELLKLQQKLVGQYDVNIVGEKIISLYHKALRKRLDVR